MKNAPWAIRAYRPEDQARLSAIWFAASSQAHAFLDVDCLNRQRQLIEKTYLAAAETWVACRDGRPLAFYQRLGFLEYGRQAEDGEGLPFEVVRMRSAMPTDRTIAPTG
ncbi:hypothetical protein CBF45_10550 [Bordetella sp. J329]|jgi:putative acetyltransferase|uniref:hypothetical protein n=1 Tax=Kerstersia gyiorum TaxID=206506 RepID=UPI000FD9FA78|nr:hypothetical protein [Kerstersia gyiorum]AZV94114.1 hypothetical protein CBF45_10550 [Bordetella sp. J329]MCH4273301.1 hypothetical protein [Kerstersia gyiorum]